jgi:microcystin-dependent protein
MRDPAQTEFDTLGKSGGEKNHTMTLAEMVAHTHGMDHYHGININSGDRSADHYHVPGGGGGVFYDSMNAAFNWQLAAGTSVSQTHASTHWSSGGHYHNVAGTTNWASQVSAPWVNTGSNGSTTPFNVLDPYLVVNKVIKT